MIHIQNVASSYQPFQHLRPENHRWNVSRKTTVFLKSHSTDTDWTKKIDVVFRYEKRRQSVRDFTCSTREIRWATAQPQHIKHFFLNILPKPHRSESIQGHSCRWISQLVISWRFQAREETNISDWKLKEDGVCLHGESHVFLLQQVN